MWFYFVIPAFCFEHFMCKVLRLGFFSYKVMIYFLIFFYWSLELEADQVFQPPTPLCPLNLARKDKEWTKVGSKWKCKVCTCIIAYCAKWLLTKHLKEVHGLVVEKAKPRRLSTSIGGPRHQDHGKMNVCILGNAQAMQRQNDQKLLVAHMLK
jgi:hypothetical protein